MTLRCVRTQMGELELVMILAGNFPPPPPPPPPSSPQPQAAQGEAFAPANLTESGLATFTPSPTPPQRKSDCALQSLCPQTRSALPETLAPPTTHPPAKRNIDLLASVRCADQPFGAISPPTTTAHAFDILGSQPGDWRASGWACRVLSAGFLHVAFRLRSPLPCAHDADVLCRCSSLALGAATARQPEGQARPCRLSRIPTTTLLSGAEKPLFARPAPERMELVAPTAATEALYCNYPRYERGNCG